MLKHLQRITRWGRAICADGRRSMAVKGRWILGILRNDSHSFNGM